MPHAQAPDPEFQRLLAGDLQADLTRIAIELARDAYPDLRAEPILATIEELADRVRDRCPTGSKVRHVLGQINWVLYIEENYRGNTDEYHDPRNSYLNEVIERKTGIPISLGVLYRAIAERVGLRLDGANLPAHFMLRLGGQGDEPLFVDAFAGGDLLDREACQRRLVERTGHPLILTEREIGPCSTATIVGRMLLNLKGLYVQAGDYASALPVQARLARLNADDPCESRDLGMIHLQLDQPGRAIPPIERYLAEKPEADDAPAVRALLAAAWREIARLN